MGRKPKDVSSMLNDYAVVETSQKVARLILKASQKSGVPVATIGNMAVQIAIYFEGKKGRRK